MSDKRVCMRAPVGRLAYCGRSAKHIGLGCANCPTCLALFRADERAEKNR